MTKPQIDSMLAYIHQANACLDWTLKLFDPENDPKNFRTIDTPEGEVTEDQIENKGSVIL